MCILTKETSRVKIWFTNHNVNNVVGAVHKLLSRFRHSKYEKKVDPMADQIMGIFSRGRK